MWIRTSWNKTSAGFSKRIRLAAEKSLSDSFKVRLHENGIGYVAYHKSRDAV